jgi:hypothetical protein
MAIVDVKEVVTRKVEKVFITLRHDEATILVEILARVGGDPRTSRGHATAIYNGLMAKGIYPRSDHNIDGQIYYKD